MRLSTAVVLALVALLVTSTLGVGFAAASAASSAAGNGSQADEPMTQQEIRIDLKSNGDAVWTVSHYYAIETDADRDAFTEFGTQIVAGERETGYDVTRFEQFTATAEASTGRPMTVAEAGWLEPRITDREEIDALAGSGDVGVLTYTFRWTQFADQDGQNLVLGDVFRTEQGTWLPALTETQRLVIAPPPNYGVVDAERAPSGGRGLLIWDGPHEFSTAELSATYIPGSDPEIPGLSWAETGLLLVAVVVFGGGAFYVARARDLFDTDDSPPDPGPASAPEPEADASTPPPESASQSSTANAQSTSATKTDEPSHQATAETDTDNSVVTSYNEDIDVELLSDEERVLRLLHQNGGRMKQGSIVTETDWSNAKVSQLLSKMDDNDAINKLRIGRENLITLPDVDIGEIE